MESLRERLSQSAASATLTLSATELARLEQYLLLLERWNRRINLTALPLAGFPSETLDRLVVEPFVAAAFVGNMPVRWSDVGSGGGSPGIPLKIIRPRAILTMIEAKARKTAFLREVVRNLGLVDTRVLTAQFESAASDEPASADLLSVRGVKLDEKLIGAIMRLVRPGGRLLLFQSRSDLARKYPGLTLIQEMPIPRGVLRVLTKDD